MFIFGFRAEAVWAQFYRTINDAVLAANSHRNKIQSLIGKIGDIRNQINMAEKKFWHLKERGPQLQRFNQEIGIKINFLKDLQANTQNDISRHNEEYQRRSTEIRKKIKDITLEIDRMMNEKENALQELRMGYYCNQCNRPKSQIERETGKPFEQHLTEVKGKAIPASQEKIDAKASEYDQKINQLISQKKNLEKQLIDEENNYNRKIQEVNKRRQDSTDRVRKEIDQIQKKKQETAMQYDLDLDTLENQIFRLKLRCSSAENEKNAAEWQYQQAYRKAEHLRQVEKEELIRRQKLEAEEKLRKDREEEELKRREEEKIRKEQKEEERERLREKMKREEREREEKESLRKNYEERERQDKEIQRKALQEEQERLEQEGFIERERIRREQEEQNRQIEEMRKRAIEEERKRIEEEKKLREERKKEMEEEQNMLQEKAEREVEEKKKDLERNEIYRDFEEESKEFNQNYFPNINNDKPSFTERSPIDQLRDIAEDNNQESDWSEEIQEDQNLSSLWKSGGNKIRNLVSIPKKAVRGFIEKIQKKTNQMSQEILDKIFPKETEENEIFSDAIMATTTDIAMPPILAPVKTLVNFLFSRETEYEKLMKKALSPTVDLLIKELDTVSK